MSEQQDVSKAQVSNLIFFSGIFTATIGLFAFFSPETFADYLGLDLETAKMMSFILCFMGVTECIVAKTILKQNNRK